MIYSNCCKAKVLFPSKTCSKCGQHCDTMVTCPNCQGEGTEVIDRGWMPNYGFYYPKRFLTVNCNKCSGEGFVFIDIPEDELEDYI